MIRAFTAGATLLSFVISLVIFSAIFLSIMQPAQALQDSRLVGVWRDYLQKGTGGTPGVRFPHQECFEQAAKETDLPLSLLLAVARGESDFDTKARSHANAHGLMQIQWPGTAQHLGIHNLDDLYKPCTNVSAGARYLRELMQRYDNDLHLALAAYNYGPGRIRADRAIPDGANWYSGYIYRHLQYVLGTSESAPATEIAYVSEGKLELLLFNRLYRAEAFVAHLQQVAPELRLDWFRLPLNRFRVVLLYRNSSELTSARNRLESLGVL